MRGLLLAPLLLLAGGLAFAFQGVGVAPPNSELTLQPGDRRVLTVNVFTTEKRPLTVRARYVDWTLTPEGGVVMLRPGENPYSAAAWLETTLDPFEISAERYRPVRVAVRVPEDPTLEGSYWAAVQFVSEPIGTVEKASTRVRIRVAANFIVYVTIAGTERPGAKITRFEREGSALVLDIENTGNTYLRLEGHVRLLGENGEPIQTLALPERVVLREGLARIRLALPEDVAQEAVAAVVEVWSKKPVPLPERLYAETTLR